MCTVYITKVKKFELQYSKPRVHSPIINRLRLRVTVGLSLYRAVARLAAKQHFQNFAKHEISTKLF